VFDATREWIVSIGKDKTIRIHAATDGSVVASLALPDPPLSLVYDHITHSIFTGDTRGHIAVMRLESDNQIKALNVLEGHECMHLSIT
jgi:hypothetical protein